MKKVIVLISVCMMWYASSCYTQEKKVFEKKVKRQTDKQHCDVDVVGCDGTIYRIVSVL